MIFNKWEWKIETVSLRTHPEYYIDGSCLGLDTGGDCVAINKISGDVVRYGPHTRAPVILTKRRIEEWKSTNQAFTSRPGG